MKRTPSSQPTHSKLHAALRHGFTLVELLIVLAILVLLASLVGPRLLGSKQKADINAVKAQIGMFQSALERYSLDMNRFPSTEEGLAALVTKSSTDGGSSDSSSSESSGSEATGDASTESTQGGGSWDGPYLKSESVPMDPWGKAYSYEFPPTHNKINIPDIWSFGPDGQENTDDDIKSWTGDGGGAESSEAKE